MRRLRLSEKQKVISYVFGDDVKFNDMLKKLTLKEICVSQKHMISNISRKIKELQSIKRIMEKNIV